MAGMSHTVSAQSIHRQVIGGVGGAFISDQVTYRWTAGELTVRHWKSNDGQHRLTEGFQQPELWLPASGDLQNPLIEIAPNPVFSSLRIRTLTTMDQSLFLRLVDGQGRELLSPQPLAGFQRELNFSNYPAGIYLVQIIDQEQRQVEVHKVFKGRR
jgi:hypothetical protein